MLQRRQDRARFRQYVYTHLSTLRHRQYVVRHQMMDLMWAFYQGEGVTPEHTRALVHELHKLEWSIQSEQDRFQKLERQWKDMESAHTSRVRKSKNDAPEKFLSEWGGEGWRQRFKPNHTEEEAQTQDQEQQKDTHSNPLDSYTAIYDQINDVVRELVHNKIKQRLVSIRKHANIGGGAAGVVSPDGATWLMNTRRPPGAANLPLRLPVVLNTPLSEITLGNLHNLMGGMNGGGTDPPRMSLGTTLAAMARDPDGADDIAARSILDFPQYLQLHAHGMVSPLSLRGEQMDAISDMWHGYHRRRHSPKPGPFYTLGRAMSYSPDLVFFGIRVR